MEKFSTDLPTASVDISRNPVDRHTNCIEL